MSSSEVWLRDYETAKQLADDTLAMIQVSFSDLSCPSALRSNDSVVVRMSCSLLALQLNVTTNVHFPNVPNQFQERNVKFPQGGQEASRVTAAARKKLGSLGALIDNMRGAVESASSDSM